MPSKTNRLQRRRSARRLSAHVEALESRQLLTAVVVNTAIDGTFTGTGTVSLRDAIAIANSSTTPTTITFDPTVFATPQTMQLSTPLALTNEAEATTITGPAAELTVSAGSQTGANMGWGIEDGTVATNNRLAVHATINNLTVTNGGSGHSGGILCWGTLSLNNVIANNNFGYGIENDANLTLNNVTATNNGFGIMNFPNGTLTATNIILANNTQIGLACNVGDIPPSPTNLAATATITNAAIYGNGTFGVTCNQCSLALTNATIANNGMTGFTNTNTGPISLENVTIDGNGGNGIQNSQAAGLTIANSIVAGNTLNNGAVDVAGPVTSLGFNLIGNATGSSGWLASDQKGTTAAPLNPQLSPLGNYGGGTQSMPPLAGSPAIDNGSSALVTAGVTTDQRGLPRIVNNVVDIGAAEFQTTQNFAPVVKTQPLAKTTVAGRTTTFSATASGTPAPAVQSVSFTAAAGGNPTPTVQWQISTNGTTYTNISGATSTTYKFTAAASQNGDRFRAVFTNSKGSVTSSAATLTVVSFTIKPPANQSSAFGTSVKATLGSFTQIAATAPFKVDVNWGDGSADSILTMTAAGTIPATAHTFARVGTLTVSETITDAKGHASSKATFTETVTGASITGELFSDKNGNGKLDAGEAGLTGWTVYLDLNKDGKLDAGDLSTMAIAGGDFSFTGLKADTYVVRIVPNSKYTATKPTAGTLTLTVTAGHASTGNLFGEKPIA